jgi:8-oxo-dGTP pyrophosphatase MutT (NUDIX family)
MMLDGVHFVAKLIFGERIGKSASLKVGAAAVIFDTTRQKVLLTQRTDNARWCLPGGGVEAGESADEGCVREIWEETGLQAQIVKLIGIYTNPNMITEYADGNRFQFMSFCFEAEVTGGELGLSDETTAYGYFSREEMEKIDLMEHHRLRIADAFADQEAAFIK